MGNHIPLIKEQDGILKTIEEMAISHLNYKDYEESYTIYKRIVELQDDFHDAIDILLAFVMEHASQFVNPDERIEKTKQICCSITIYIS